MKWQPIETAPREYREGGYSTRILLYCGRVLGSIRTGHWYEQVNKNERGEVVFISSGWWLDGFQHPFNQPPFSPTHWQPLPPEPGEEEEQ